MSLRENLIEPFVVEASKGHLYTIIFLHRLPQDTPPEQLPAKLLSEKLTKNHKTLAEQFPTIRWVFPYPKLHLHDANGRLKNQHWSGLSTEDRTTLELPFGSDLPYITQIVIQEAKLAGGLDKIILGGQGESAIAAHDACTAFPELGPELRRSRDVEKAFLDRFFHNPSWIDLSQLRMAGFVGMHAQNGPPTRDESDYLLSRRTSSARIVNHTILRQTPHKFIRGGYKTQTITWDGARIDAFATFLASLGIAREGCDVGIPPSPDPGALAPKARPPPTEAKPEDEKAGMTPQERHRLEILEDKKADEEARRRTLLRIEEDKRNRRYRKERERAARQHAATAAAGQDSDKDNSTQTAVGTALEPRFGSEEPTSGSQQRSATVIRQYEQRPRAWEDWPTMPDELREGWQPRPQQGMSDSQLRALGIPAKRNN